ncbi:hypothetical protein ACOMHN_044961 [Nucella lapillus]
MDSSRHPDFPSEGGGGEGGEGGVGERGGGGSRHVRPRSPSSYDDLELKPRRRSQRRQGDSSTNEIIRFVRGYHLERESTWLRLQKKAPLPSIGQGNQSQEFTFPPQSLQERRKSHTDSYEDDKYEDFILDSEVSAIEAGQRDPYRHHFGVTDDLRFSSSPRRAGVGTKRYDRREVNASYGPPASHHRHGVRPVDGGQAGSHFSPRAHARKGWGRSLKQLPPIASEDLPERPSAPSPSLTSPGEGDEELDSAGEPVDFIDIR